MWELKFGAYLRGIETRSPGLVLISSHINRFGAYLRGIETREQVRRLTKAQLRFGAYLRGIETSGEFTRYCLTSLPGSEPTYEGLKLGCWYS